MLLAVQVCSINKWVSFSSWIWSDFLLKGHLRFSYLCMHNLDHQQENAAQWICAVLWKEHGSTLRVKWKNLAGPGRPPFWAVNLEIWGQILIPCDSGELWSACNSVWVGQGKDRRTWNCQVWSTIRGLWPDLEYGAELCVGNSTIKRQLWSY